MIQKYCPVVVIDVGIQFNYHFLTGFRQGKVGDFTSVITVAVHCYTLNLLRHCCGQDLRFINCVTVKSSIKSWASGFKILVAEKEKQPVFYDWSTESEVCGLFAETWELTAVRAITDVVFIAFDKANTSVKLIGS